MPLRALHGERRRGGWQVRLLQAARSKEPACRLWAAVLLDAIVLLRRRRLSARVAEDRREAVAWVLNRDEEPLGTFESVCTVLDLDSDAVRGALAPLTAAAAAAGPSAASATAAGSSVAA